MRRSLILAGALVAIAGGMGPLAWAQRGGPPPGRGGAGAGMRERGMSDAEHLPIQRLLSGHQAIQRRVEEIPGGVRTTTTTTRPDLVPVLRTHVRQMARRLEAQRPVRIWDPVFREVFSHADEITMTVQDIENGVAVVETSPNPAVTLAIRAHAKKVDSFVAQGHQAAMPPWAGGRGRHHGQERDHGPGHGHGPGGLP